MANNIFLPYYICYKYFFVLWTPWKKKKLPPHRIHSFCFILIPHKPAIQQCHTAKQITHGHPYPKHTHTRQQQKRNEYWFLYFSSSNRQIPYIFNDQHRLILMSMQIYSSIDVMKSIDSINIFS